MKTFYTATEMSKQSRLWQREGIRIGFVPTMGALHEGHLSLVRRARRLCDIVAVSIFVNPTQFGPKEDFDRYPRYFDRDCSLLEQEECEAVFAPSAEEMYPVGYSTYVQVETVSEGLCGASRPGHFRGVATIVLKLLHIVDPDVAVFGQKDAQQVMVIRRMVRDLNMRVRIEVAPTVREADGLAMSSRNAYLTSAERQAATLIYAALCEAQAAFERGETLVTRLRAVATKVIEHNPLLELEYLECVDFVTARPVSNAVLGNLMAVACRTKESHTRLIDNIILGGSD